MDDINKEEIEAFEKIRASGKYNMFTEANDVMCMMNLNPRHQPDHDRYWTILRNYSELMKKFNIERM